MRLRIDWKEAAEAVGVMALVASLVFVGLQLHQTEVIAQSQILSSNMGNRIDTNTAIATHAEIWARASSDEPLTAVEEIIVDRLLDSLTVERVALAVHFQSHGDDTSSEVILADFAGLLADNPGLHRRWLAREQRFMADRSVLLGPGTEVQLWVERMMWRVEQIKQTRGQTGAEESGVPGDAPALE